MLLLINAPYFPGDRREGEKIYLFVRGRVSPGGGIAGVVPVVSQDEKRAGRHGKRAEIVPVEQFVRPGMLRVNFQQLFTVNQNFFVPDLHRVARQGYHSFDRFVLLSHRRAENDYLAP